MIGGRKKIGLKLRLCGDIHECAFKPRPPARLLLNSIENVSFRYELLRRKTQQPLATEAAPAPPRPGDLHRWLHVYSGAKLFYQDKGLSR